MTEDDRAASARGERDRAFDAVCKVPVRHLIGRGTYRAVRGAAASLARVTAASAERRTLPGGASVRIFRPAGSPGDRIPGLLWIHGGGFVVGTAGQDDLLCRWFSRQTGRVVVSVDYRLAPEHPYPAALDDCRAGLELLRSLPEVDGDAVVVSGASAGGGLAAQLVHELIRRGDPVPAAQILFYPMLDPSVRSKAQEPKGLRVWDARSNRFGWDSYLGGTDGFVPVIDSVSPAVPRTWIGVGTADLFHDESVRYADALRAVGVDVELVTVAGGIHGFDVAAWWTRTAKEFKRSAVAVIRG